MPAMPPGMPPAPSMTVRWNVSGSAWNSAMSTLSRCSRPSAPVHSARSRAASSISDELSIAITRAPTGPLSSLRQAGARAPTLRGAATLYESPVGHRDRRPGRIERAACVRDGTPANCACSPIRARRAAAEIFGFAPLSAPTSSRWPGEHGEYQKSSGSFLAARAVPGRSHPITISHLVYGDGRDQRLLWGLINGWRRDLRDNRGSAPLDQLPNRRPGVVRGKARQGFCKSFERSIGGKSSVPSARAATRRSAPGTRSSGGASKPGSMASSRCAARGTARSPQR